MKVLLVNNYYYFRGGDCTYFFSIKKHLEANGHDVAVFSMEHPSNIETPFNKYFVSYINYDDEVKNVTVRSGIKVLKRTVYSSESRRNIEELIEREKPDIAHIHNIHHHITPSILFSLKKRDIPIVWTLHDYTLICPNTSFLSKERICEKCRKKRYFWPVIERCKKESISASSVAALETITHELMHIYDMVDLFIAPSEFVRSKFIEYGFDPRKILRMELFSNIELKRGDIDTGSYYMYIGRLSYEKGLKTLIGAASRIDSSELKIVGDGPMKEQLMKYASSIEGGERIHFVGYKTMRDIVTLYDQCKFTVVPSEWYEPSGLIILESFSRGKPVIGSRIGGITELVLDTERGLLFEPGDPEDLRAAIRFLLANPDLIKEMGENARNYVRKMHNPHDHYKKLLDIYESVLARFAVKCV